MKQNGLLYLFFLFIIPGYSFQVAEKSTVPSVKIDSLIILGKQFQYTHPDSSYYFTSEALEVAKKEGLKLQEGICQQFLGEILFQQGIYSEAAEKWIVSEAIMQDIKNHDGLVNNYNLTGRLFYKTKSADLSLESHQKAFDLAVKTGNKLGQAVSLGWIGAIHEKSGDYSLALDCQWKALKILQDEGLDDLSADIKENLGSIYEDTGSYDSAFYYFKEAYSLNLQTGDSLILINNINNLGDIYRKKGLLDSALLFTNQALEMSRRYQDIYQLSSAYRDISKIYYEAKNFQQAYTYLDSSRMSYQEIYSSESARQMALMEALYDVEFKDREIIKLQEIHSFDRKVKILLIILVLVIFGLSVVIFSRQKLKAAAAEALMLYQKEGMETKQKLIETELNNVLLKEQQMKQELESNTKALTAETLHVIDKNRLMEEIREKLKNTLVDDFREQKKKIRNLVKMIDNNFVKDTDWDDFRNNFEKVHEKFYQNLQEISQELSPADLRLATLMKLNLNSKDIASTLSISPESLRISRYRLKKKLNLKKSDSLQNFILSL
ncbi:tetratricopeptide repeat protein [Belliella marina]|uniref:Tetratricopeptide repeat protein n=1 Tax=Belliella marina TaxID=1644146 RepID=A0ABW4VLB3_9BACT